ncbi:MULTISPECIES: hypothetical protein [Halorussus]|uniref:hypothetical protein n=1 Tax=Halorussus TaxID=1070314 RepID=UPI00209D150D|nr:hypothetical protein [Halorussus vallis]USZ77979.1 hypothetical protein NGM07_22660 [Halorussus vallis]USZ78011.1 hypothetical protein NGM07_20325 [Halorussus vallis]
MDGSSDAATGGPNRRGNGAETNARAVAPELERAHPDPPFVFGLNVVAEHVVGFEGLVQLQARALLLGAAIVLVIGTLSAVVAGWRTAKTVGIESLPR